MSEGPDDASLPLLPAFDRRVMRRAIRRGVVRTAFLAALWIVVGAIVLAIAGGVTQTVLGTQHDVNTLVDAWNVAHPEYVGQFHSEGGGGWWTAKEDFNVVPIGVGETAGPTPMTFRESLLGNFSRSSADPSDAASQVLTYLRQQTAGFRDAERKELNALPSTVVVAAIVEFKDPLDEGTYDTFVSHQQEDAPTMDSDTVLMSWPRSLETSFVGASYIRGVYGWRRTMPMSFGSPVVAGFRKWVDSLRNGPGAGELRQVGIDLPSLRAAAREGRVHGVIVTDASPAYLLKLLADPLVGAVHPFDIAFRVEGADGG